MQHQKSYFVQEAESDTAKERVNLAQPFLLYIRGFVLDGRERGNLRLYLAKSGKQEKAISG